MKKRKRHSQKGFTLIELVIAISLLIIIGAIASPSFSGLAMNQNLKSAARNIQFDFLNLKEKAVSESRAYRITFDAAGNRYFIEQGTESGNPYQTLETKTPTSFGGGIGIKDVAFGAGASSVTFQQSGITTNGNIVLMNSKGSTATITTSISGRTYVQLNLQ